MHHGPRADNVICGSADAAAADAARAGCRALCCAHRDAGEKTTFSRPPAVNICVYSQQCILQAASPRSSTRLLHAQFKSRYKNSVALVNRLCFR